MSVEVVHDSRVVISFEPSGSQRRWLALRPDAFVDRIFIDVHEMGTDHVITGSIRERDLIDAVPLIQQLRKERFGARPSA